MKIRYALDKKPNGYYPRRYYQIFFRENCERTSFDPRTGEDESIIQVRERLEKRGYSLLESVQDLERSLQEDENKFKKSFHESLIK